jgi:hypothetical protein
LVSVVLVALSAGSAAAGVPPCPVPHHSAEQIVTQAVRSDGTRYLQSGEYVVIARVEAVNDLPDPTPALQTSSPGSTRPVAGPARPYLGGSEVLLTALAYFVGPGRGRDLRILVPDPSLTQFIPRQGKAYFIPLRSDGSLKNDYDCSIMEMTSDTGPALEQGIDRLIAAATAKGVPAARVPTAGTTATATAAATTAASEQDGVTAPRRLINTLHFLGGVGPLIAIVMLVKQNRTLTRLRRHPDRHNIDGGDVNGHTTGVNSTTVQDALTDAMRTKRWIVVALAVSLVASLVANVLPST